MWDSIIFYLFFTISLINVLHLGFYLVGANMYDIAQFRRKKLREQNGKPSNQPLVSVLIPAHNEEKSILRCLESVQKSSYENIQIIVVNDASNDKTEPLIWGYARKNRKEYQSAEIIDINDGMLVSARNRVRRYVLTNSDAETNRSFALVNLKKNVGKASGLNYLLKNIAKGSLVMTLDGDSILDSQAIERAVAYFDDEKIVGVAANVRIMDSPTILGLLQKFEHMLGYRSKKFYSLTNSEYIVGGVASTYRMSVVQKVQFYDHDTITEDIGLSLKIVSMGNRDQRIIYAADVAAMTEGVHSFGALLKQRYRWKMGGLQNLFKYKSLFANRKPEYSPLLTFYRIPMAFAGELLVLIEFCLLAYIMALTIAQQNPGMFVGAYMMISLYVLLTIIPDEHMNLKGKLKITAYVPILYFIFFIMNIVQVVSVVRCLLHYKQFTRREGVTGVWKSPERLGEPVTT